MEKRAFRWLYVYIVLVVLLLSAPYWLWWLKPETELELLIVDDTVPDRSYREHQGLVWLLRAQEYVHRNGETYDAARDYVGFVPKGGGAYEVRPLPNTMDGYDAVYVADGERSFSFPALEGNVLPARQFYTYTWPTWETPRYHERLKPSYEAMKAAFSGADIAKRQGNE
ncbi:hypothetical protein ACPVTF_08330 [Geobacillus icigianus]|uniref:Uncharacterized protein n=1 Tax=Geobacillus subterraneus TaxID=129338 RepID=A0A679FJ65_9BACL|nr:MULTISPECIES: hypothetical protein [Geobacillus]KYD29303.1 hypothetical protein B4113_2246 [Geobacillus sp. B4113_201601]BBW96402.1 hypothetical protein GsuE55_12350 [Geobacillus subterraneus]